jgi:hypothetical protein
MSVGFYITFIGLLTRRYIEQTPFMPYYSEHLDGSYSEGVELWAVLDRRSKSLSSGIVNHKNTNQEGRDR